MATILCNPDDPFRFSARWIGLPDADDQPNVYFRAYRSFTLTEVPTAAPLRICADSYYLLYINGRRVHFGPTRGTWTINYFDTIDVAEYLCNGENHIAVIVHSPITETFIASPVETALILELPGHAATGPEWLVQSAPDWKRDVTLFSLQTDYMEYRDFRLEPAAGWLTGKLEGAWLPARLIAADSELYQKRLAPRNVPAMREFECRPVHATRFNEVDPNEPGAYPKLSTMLNADVFRPLPAERLNNPGALTSIDQAVCELLPDPVHGRGASFILDFGSDLIGRLAVKVEAPAGTVVDVIYSEEIWQQKNDRLRAEYECNPTYNFSDRYVLREGENIIGTQLTEHGFRMVQLTFRDFAAPIRIREAKVFANEYPYVRRGAFHSSDPMLNKIWEVCVETLQICTTDVFMDCPWRERAFWVNDLVVENRTTLAAFGASPVHKRAFELAFAQQREDGLLPGVCPAPHGDATKSCVLLPTNLLIVTMLKDYLMASGDYATVGKHLAAVETILNLFETFTDEKGVLTAPDKIWNFFDWGFELNDYHFRNRRESMLNFLYVTALKTYCELCDRCGRACDRAAMTARAERTAQAAEREFVSPETGYLVDPVWHRDQPATISSQLAHAFALLSGEVSDGARKRFLAALTDPALLRPEYYLHLFVFEAMRQGSDTTLADGLARIRRDWGKCIATGSPTLYEAGIHKFGREAFGDGGSLCHGFGTAPIEFCHAAILGVRPLEPGFVRFEAAPKLFDLTFASGRIPTPAGEIVIDCRRSADGIELTLEVPPGLTAECGGRQYGSGIHQLRL